ncbi:MAG: ABC transporter permease subunit [Anaerolineales bacterium]|nr:ABC transporter permease subunit [Anaerolineales bacterium]
MFWRMITIEQQKLTRRAMFWVEMGLLLLIVVAFFGGIFGIRQALLNGVDTSGSDGGLVITGIDVEMATDLLTWPLGIATGFSIVNGVGTFLIIILAGTFVAQEYGWRTVQLWLTRGVPRPVVMLAKFTAVTIVTFIFVMLVALMGTGITAVFSQSYLGNIPVDTIQWGQLILSIFLGTVALLPYAALAFFLGVVSRSTVVAIGGGLAFTSLIEPLLGSLAQFLDGRWAAFAGYLPNQLHGVLSSQLAEISSSGLPVTAAGDINMITAVSILTLYVVLFVGAAVVVFQRQDVGG